MSNETSTSSSGTEGYPTVWEWPDGSYAIVSDYQLLIEVERCNFHLQLAPLLGAHYDPQRVLKVQSPDDDDDIS